MNNKDYTIKNLELDYWRISNKLDLFEYITPQNMAEEKTKFLHKYKLGIKYNPHFLYRNPQLWINDVVHDLVQLQYQFISVDHPISKYYIQYIIDDIHFIHNVINRSSNEFPYWLSSLYGLPDEVNLIIAKNILNKLNEEDNRVNYCISAKKVKQQIHQTLERHGFSDWIVFMTTSSARISVNPARKEIKISEGAFFDPNEIKRLMVHEIGVHVLRAENGSRQFFMLFAKGFPKYLQTEEGLAIYAEKHSGVLSSIAIIKYCCRLIASYLCHSLSFYDTFEGIRTYLNDSDSFDIVARIKRGLNDTSTIGGFTKDQAYLSGFLEIEKLEKEIIRELFIGKIGVSDLDDLKEFNLVRDFNYPLWLDGLC